MKKTYTLHRFISFMFIAGILFILPSCYSVRISNIRGTPEPDPMNFNEGYFRGKAVHVIDTTVNIGLLDNEVMFIESCSTGGFQVIEYRVTLGHVLLSGITFGKVRKIKMKYVCLKPSN